MFTIKSGSLSDFLKIEDTGIVTNGGTFAGLITANKPQNATSSFAFQNLDTTGTSVRTHLTATAGNRSIRLEAIHSDYSYVVRNNTRMYFQTNDGSNNTLAYTKTGRVVHVGGQFRVGSVSSPDGEFIINLPFTSANGGSMYCSGTYRTYNIDTFDNMLKCSIKTMYENALYFIIYKSR